MIKEILRIENLFDQKSIAQADFSKELEPLVKAIQLFDCKQYFELCSFVKNHIQAETNIDLAGCLIQFAISASETIFDLNLRAKMIDLWQLVNNPEESDYCNYLQTYQFATGCFYNGQLSESQFQFELCLNLAEKMNYRRGQMRTIYHLALIARDRGFTEKFLDLIKRSQQLAEDLNAARWLQKIENLFSSTQNRRILIDVFLEQKNWIQVRKIYLKLNSERNKRREPRSQHSDYVFLAMLCLHFNKTMAFNLILKNTTDSIVLEKILYLKSVYFTLTKAEQAKLNFLRMKIGKSKIIIKQNNPAETELAGIRLKDIDAQDVKSFLQLMASKHDQIIHKQDICQQVWGYDYDPIIHDGKIYKLIHKTKKMIHANDLILNKYGSYQLNPKFIKLNSQIA